MDEWTLFTTYPLIIYTHFAYKWRPLTRTSCTRGTSYFVHCTHLTRLSDIHLRRRGNEFRECFVSINKTPHTVFFVETFNFLFVSDGEPIKLPENLETLPRADHFPTQRHRWNTNEVSLHIYTSCITDCLTTFWHGSRMYGVKSLIFLLPLVCVCVVVMQCKSTK